MIEWMLILLTPLKNLENLKITKFATKIPSS